MGSTNKNPVSCVFCKKGGNNIFNFETLDDWILGWNGKITNENACRSNNAVFIDRGFLRMVNADDSQCLDHGEKIKIKYCPFCGRTLAS
jgi:hypothetical protein